MSHQFGNISMEDARKLAQTEAGQKLLSLLQAQNPQQLRSAMEQAASGEYEQLKKTLVTFMASEQAQALLKQLEKQAHE